MAGGNYRILIHGDLDDTRILQKIAAVQKKFDTMTIGGKGKGGGAYFADAGKEAKKGAKGMSAYVKGTERATKSTKRFGQSTIDITKKVVQFGATTAVIRGVTSGMADMVNKTFELDSALTEFKKVSDLSGKGLEKYTEQAFKTGRSVAKTGTEMIQASTEFRKSGFNDQDSMKLGKVAMMFSNIADAELSAGDAAGFITSQIRADYKDISTEADKASMQIIDAINEVSNTQAVSSTDLSMAMSKVGSALQVNNNNYAESLGMVVAGTERMHGQASKVGRGIRTIGANISKLQKESKTLDLQTKDGVKTIDLWDKKTGQVKSTYEVFKEFAGVWDDMTPDQQQALSLEMAGKNQQEVFASVVGNWKNAEKAAKTATNQIENGGSAIKENAKYLGSMAGHLENLKSAWSEFSNSMVKSEGLKKGMDTLAGFLRFLSSDAGHNLLGMAAGLTATYIAAKPLVGLFSKGKAIKDFMVFAGAFGKTETKLKAGANTFSGTAKRFTKMSDNFVVQSGRTTKATKGLKQAAGAAAGAMNPLGLAVAAVGAAMAVNAVGIYKAYKETHKYREAADELTVSNQKSIKSIEDNAERAEFLTETLDRLNGVEHKTQGQKELLKQTVKELNELYPELNLKYDEGKDKINKTTDAIRDYIKAMQEEAKAAAYKSNLEKSVKQQLKLEEKRKKAIDNLTEAQKQYDKEVQSGYVSQATSQRLAKAKNEFKDLQDAYIQTTKEVTKQSNNMVKSSGAWDKLVKKAKKAGTEIPESVKKGIEDGTYAIPESMKQLESLISLDKLSQKVKQTPVGKSLVESLEQGLREGKLDIGQALDIESEMNKMGGKMNTEAKKAVQNLVDSFNSGQIDFDQFEKGMNKISDDMSAIDKKKVQPKVDIKGGEKAEKEIGKVTDDLKTASKTKAKPEIEVKGGDKSQKEAKDTKEALEEVNGQESEASIHVEGGEETAEATKTSADALELVNGYEAEATVSQTGAEQATNETNSFQTVVLGLTGNTVQVGQTGAGQAAGEVGGLQGIVSGLTGNTVMVQEEGAAPSMGRVLGLNSAVNSMQSRTVQETANVSGAGSVASLVGYQNSLHNKTVTYTVITEKKQKASGTKNFEGGLAEVNEYGYEYIRDVQTGMLRVANKGRRGLTLLNKGDAVYTHGQSMQMRQKAEESLPKFASGKRSKVQKIQDKYDDAVEYLEYLQDKKHFSDSWLAKRMKKAYNKYSKKAKKAGGSLTKKQYRELSLAIENAKYDKLTESLETEVTNLGLGFGRGRGKFSKKGNKRDVLEAKEVKAERKRLKRLKKQHKISEEDYKKYMDDIYHTYIEGQMKLTLADEKSTKSMKKILKKYVKEGKITWEEYYDYVSELNGKILDKEIANLGLGSGTGRGKYSNKGKESRYLEKSEVNAEIKRLENLRKKGEITAEQFAEYKEEIYHNYADSQMAMYEAGKISADKMQKVLDDLVKKGEITWAEYYDYLDELEDDRHDKLINDLDKEIASLGKGTGQGAGKYSGKGKESKYLEWSEVTAERDRLKQLRKEGKITAEEYNEYMDEIYHTYVDDRMKMYETGKITAEQMQDTLLNQVKYGRITWTEYYDYLDQIAEQEHEKQLARIEKEIENLGLGVGSAKGAYSTGNARYLELAEVNAEIKALKALVVQGEITQEEFEGFMDTIYHKYADSQMKMYEEGKISATDITNTLDSLVSEGKITWSEYYDYIDSVNEKIKDQQIKFIEDEINAYTLRNESIDDAIKKIKELAKAGGLTAEEEKEYIKQIKQKYLDQYYTLYTNGKKTYQEMKSLIVQYYKDGILNAEEYYAKLDELSQNQFSVEQERLNKMQEQKENENSLAKSWIQRRIDDLEKQNEQIEKQNDLLEVQKNLEEAQAKRVKIYRQGQGFVYEKDTEAIREATKALQDYKKEQGNPEVNALKEILELFEDNEELANIRNLENITGSTYDALFGSLGTDVNLWTRWIQDNLSATNGIGLLLNAMGDIQDPTAMAQFLNANGLIDDSKIKSYINQARFASGTLSTPAGFARVGEQGYEIALLGAGNAIMPHNISEHLMSWGQYSPNDLINNIGGATYAYQFDNLVLPNVTNAQDFIRELKQLPNKAIQTSIGRTM